MLRLYGAPQGRLAAAVARFAPQWRAEAQWKCRGAETLLAVHADTPSGLKKAAQSLRSSFGADVYGAGDTSLAAAAVQALEAHDRLLACGDAAAGALLEARLEKVPGAEKVYDFGTMSYADAKTGPQIEKRARAKLGGEGDKPEPVRLALARAQAARRIVGTELAVACAERESDHVLVLSAKKGCWLRTVPAADNAALWLLDMIRRAAAGLPQAEGTGFLPAGQASPEPRRNPATKEEAPPPRPAGGALAAGAGGSGRWVVSHRRRPCRPSGAAEGPAPARVDHPLAGPRAEARCKTDIKHNEAASRRRVGRRPRFSTAQNPAAKGRFPMRRGICVKIQSSDSA